MFDPHKYSWKKYHHFKEKEYTRNLVIGNNLFELMILCWSPQSGAPIHDHPSDGCWMIGVQGSILEERYKRDEDSQELKKTSTTILSQGDISYMHNYIGYHSVGNHSKTENAVTLHIYSPPIRKCHIFEENGEKTLKSCHYFSKFGKKVNDTN